MTRRRAEPTCHHYCNTWNCPECFRRFWLWLQSHSYSRPTSRRAGFYEAAARNRATNLRPI